MTGCGGIGTRTVGTIPIPGREFKIFAFPGMAVGCPRRIGWGRMGGGRPGGMRDVNDGGSAGGKGGGGSFMLWVDEARGCGRTGGSRGASFLTSLGGSGPGELCENEGW